MSFVGVSVADDIVRYHRDGLVVVGRAVADGRFKKNGFPFVTPFDTNAVDDMMKERM